jgi:hypothetical protein
VTSPLASTLVTWFPMATFWRHFGDFRDPRHVGNWQLCQISLIANPPNFSKMSAKCRHGKSCEKCGCEGRSRQFPANSLINGYNKKPFSQNRGGELLSTLLQCQSLPTSFPTSWESEYSAYIVNSPLYKLRRGGNSASVRVASLYRQHLCGGYWTIKNKAGHNSTRGTVSSLLFSCWKILLHTVYIFNILNVDWDLDSWPL